MEDRCSQKKVSLTYPKHIFKPEDLLNFVESTQFTQAWDAANLDVEDDLLGLQLCIMTSPYGDELIEGTGGLRRHLHKVETKFPIMVYYAYFEDFGVVYLNFFDKSAKRISFSENQTLEIRNSIVAVEKELLRRKIIT